MALASGAGAVALLTGRLFFGGLLAFAGVNHFASVDEMTEQAAANGIPMARFGVVTTGVMLLAGGLGIVAGAYPVLSAGMLLTFFVVVTPAMHDFWTVEDEERKEAELTNFLKNMQLLGASVVFLALGDQTWGYVLDVGLWL